MSLFDPSPGSRYDRFLDHCPVFVLSTLSLLEDVKEGDWLAVAARLCHTEWTEAPGMFPHCCSQGGCWAHTDVPACFCRQGLFGGACVWCRLADLSGKRYPADEDWRRRHREHHNQPDPDDWGFAWEEA